MRANLVAAAGEGRLSSLQGWPRQDPPDTKAQPRPPACPSFFRMGPQHAPLDTRCHAGHGTGAQRARDRPHGKTRKAGECRLAHPTRPGVTRSGMQARAIEEEEE